MRCYYVLAHGTLHWLATGRTTDVVATEKPDGVWCHRFVLAPNPEAAERRALAHVVENLEREFGWLSSGAVTADLQAAEVSPAAMHKLLKRDNKGHTFYCNDDGS